MIKINDYKDNIENVINELSIEINQKNGLLEIEENLVKWLNELGNQMLQEILNKAKEPTYENVIYKDDTEYRYNKDATLTLKNRFGKQIKIKRRYYYPVENKRLKKKGFSPMDEKLG